MPQADLKMHSRVNPAPRSFIEKNLSFQVGVRRMGNSRAGFGRAAQNQEQGRQEQ